MNEMNGKEEVLNYKLLMTKQLNKMLNKAERWLKINGRKNISKIRGTLHVWFYEKNAAYHIHCLSLNLNASTDSDSILVRGIEF